MERVNEFGNNSGSDTDTEIEFKKPDSKKWNKTIEKFTKNQ